MQEVLELQSCILLSLPHQEGKQVADGPLLAPLHWKVVPSPHDLNVLFQQQQDFIGRVDHILRIIGMQVHLKLDARRDVAYQVKVVEVKEV